MCSTSTAGCKDGLFRTNSSSSSSSSNQQRLRDPYILRDCALLLLDPFHKALRPLHAVAHFRHHHRHYLRDLGDRILPAALLVARVVRVRLHARAKRSVSGSKLAARAARARATTHSRSRNRSSSNNSTTHVPDRGRLLERIRRQRRVLQPLRQIVGPRHRAHENHVLGPRCSDRLHLKYQQHGSTQGIHSRDPYVDVPSRGSACPRV